MPERNVYFYRCHSDLNPDGTAEPYDPTPALEHIDAIPFQEGNRYVGAGDGEVTCGWIDSLRTPQRICLGKVRRRNLPALEEQGELRPLDIPEEAGIAEQTHMVFFPNNIVGMLFNFYGPRMASLRDYLKRLHPDTPNSLSIDPLLRQDVLDQLDRLRKIRVFDLRILRPFMARLQQADQSLHDAFSAAQEVGEAEQFQLILKPPPNSRDWIADRFLDIARRVARIVSGDPDANEEVTSFKVRGQNEETESMETVDVLRDRLVVKKNVEVAGDRTRRLDPDSAYGAVTEAYEELEGDLRQAAAVFQQ